MSQCSGVPGMLRTTVNAIITTASGTNTRRDVIGTGGRGWPMRVAVQATNA